MTILSYQIQNIIQTYNRQLKSRRSQNVSSDQKNANIPKDVVEISSEDKKKHILDRAGDEAIKKLKEQTLKPYRKE